MKNDSSDLPGREFLGACPRPRIVLAVTKSELGGAQRHVLDLALGLRKKGSVELVTGGEGWLTAEAAEIGIPVHVVRLDNTLSPLRNVGAFNQLRRLLRQIKPDIVHLHSTKMGLLGRWAAHAEGIPAIYTAHGWPFGPAYGLMRRRATIATERLAAGCSAHIIAVSVHDRDLALRHLGLPPDRITVIHNGIADRAPEPARPEGGPVRIVMVARLASPKDPVTAIRAVGKVPGLELDLLGHGPDATDVEAEIRRLRLTERVRIVPPPHVDPWSRADIALLSSRSEGFPLVVIEAMRSGRPVVASRVGGVGEAVEDGRTGILFQAGDEEGLARALARLAGDRELRLSMGAAGRSRFETQFRASDMLDAVWGVYQDVLTANARR